MDNVEPTPVEVFELSVNLDDVTPEVLGHTQQKLLEAGALDVWTTAIGMKKQRPGVMLSLLCTPAQRDAMARQVLELTGTFGVRFRPWGRLILQRRHEKVGTPYGTVRLKIGYLNDRILAVRPEFEDLVDLAHRAGVPTQLVQDAAQAAAQQWRQDQGST